MAYFTLLPARSFISLAGADRQSFLQGLVSNDVTRVDGTHAIHAAFLTPQGRYLHDFFIAERDATLLLETEAARAADLKRRLGLYKLRASITLADGIAGDGAWSAAAVWGDDQPASLGARLGLTDGQSGRTTALAEGLAFIDPRLAALGARVWLPTAEIAARLRARGLTETAFEAYDRHRLALGIPDGSRDLMVDKAILLENGFDELNGVDWKKGCYIGQELTARTKYRGLVKKRLVPVRVEGALPEPGTLILEGEREVGELRSGLDGRALALLRLDALNGDLRAGGSRLIAETPDWLRLPPTAESAN